MMSVSTEMAAKSNIERNSMSLPERAERCASFARENEHRVDTVLAALLPPQPPQPPSPPSPKSAELKPKPNLALLLDETEDALERTRNTLELILKRLNA